MSKTIAEQYQVRTRYGWGWEVTGPDEYASCPVESQGGAQALAEVLNAGVSGAEAVKAAGLRAVDGRLYHVNA